MSKRRADSEPLNQNETKRTKETPFNLLAPKDEFSHMITFLKIGEIVMLSLSCKLINNLLNEHVRILHPYYVVVDSSSDDGKYLEWSIGRALLTHQKMQVNNMSIEKVDEILDEMIRKKEPFSKLTKHVHVRNIVEEDDEVEIDELLESDLARKFSKLFSKPIHQSQENVKFITLSNNWNEKLEETKIISQRNLSQMPRLLS